MPLGLVSSETNPDGDVTAYSYDAAGSVTATYQGQMVAFSAGSATFNNLPQSPGLTRTFNVYVNSTSAPGSGQTTITDSDSGSPAFSFSGSSVTPLGGNWYLLGTVTLAAGDLSSTVTVAYSGWGTVSQVTLLEQTSATVYDGQENPLSVTDALGNVSATTFDNLDRSITTSQGQSVPLASGAATFSNVPQVPGQNRTFAVYVNAAPGSGETTITDSDSGSPTFTFSGASTTPLGSGWYLLGTVTLAAGDLSSTVTVQYSGSGVAGSACSRPPRRSTMPRAMSSRRPTAWAMSRPTPTTICSSRFQVRRGRSCRWPRAVRRWPTCRRRRAWPGPLRSTCRRVRPPCHSWALPASPA